ncbi:MAG: hypothetical protein LBH07_00250 [Treponema sp.]|jgi:hypothetical protein|nr:hypothetical protein [Treponema sp.]
MAGGITVFAERPHDFTPESIEVNVLSALNGTLTERKIFIENDLLQNAGFRRTGNVRYRKTDGTEKALSILHGIGRLFSFGIVPLKPFSEIDYNQLPKGVYYTFQTVINSSEFNNISSLVLTIMEIEYKLQIEFNNGILYSDNINYYTEENINDFEKLIIDLPEFPEKIKQIRDRFLNFELPKIKRSLEKHNNQSENYLRAIENLREIF